MESLQENFRGGNTTAIRSKNAYEELREGQEDPTLQQIWLLTINLPKNPSILGNIKLCYTKLSPVVKHVRLLTTIDKHQTSEQSSTLR